MNLEVPYFSQLNEAIPKDIRKQVCGICCVKMILDFYIPNQDHDINQLLREAELIGAFDKVNKIWLHDGLVRIMRNHGVLAYPQEFRSVTVNLETEEFLENKNQKEILQKGIEKIIFRLKKGYPVIASVKKGFSDNQDSHMVVIKGYIKNDSISLILNDPLMGADQIISLDYFLNYWRKFLIFSR